jgi:hypothetical protein
MLQLSRVLWYILHPSVGSKTGGFGGLVVKNHRRVGKLSLIAAAGATLMSMGSAHAATVARYSFDTMTDSNDTAAGERLLDSSGNGFNLTKNTLASGAFQLNSDIPSGAPAGSMTIYNHGSPFVDTPASDRFSIAKTGELSVEFWWKPIQANTINYVLQFPGGGSNSKNSWGLYQTVPDANFKFGLKAFMYDDGPNGVSFPELSTGNIFDTDGFTALNAQWSHIALTMDAAKTGRLYLNGSLVSSHSYSGTNYQPTSASMRLGANYQGNFTGGFLMDDLRISDTALSAAQLANNTTLSQAPNPGPRPASLGEVWVRQRPMVLSSWGIAANEATMPLFVGTGVNHALNNRSGYHTGAAYGLNAQMLGSFLGFDDEVKTQLHIHSNAPNLTSYFIRDEIPPEEIADIAQQAAYIRSLDSNRPIIAGLGSSELRASLH